jgi:hypothetical protein
MQIEKKRSRSEINTLEWLNEEIETKHPTVTLAEWVNLLFQKNSVIPVSLTNQKWEVESYSIFSLWEVLDAIECSSTEIPQDFRKQLETITWWKEITFMLWSEERGWLWSAYPYITLPDWSIKRNVIYLDIQGIKDKAKKTWISYIKLLGSAINQELWHTLNKDSEPQSEISSMEVLWIDYLKMRWNDIILFIFEKHFNQLDPDQKYHRNSIIPQLSPWYIEMLQVYEKQMPSEMNWLTERLRIYILFWLYIRKTRSWEAPTFGEKQAFEKWKVLFTNKNTTTIKEQEAIFEDIYNMYFTWNDNILLKYMLNYIKNVDPQNSLLER